jgi:hypothetical protein
VHGRSPQLHDLLVPPLSLVHSWLAPLPWLANRLPHHRPRRPPRARGVELFSKTFETFSENVENFFMEMLVETFWHM